MGFLDKNIITIIHRLKHKNRITKCNDDYHSQYLEWNIDGLFNNLFSTRGKMYNFRMFKMEGTSIITHYYIKKKLGLLRLVVGNLPYNY